MLMADTLAITLVIIGFLLAFPALWLVSRGFWPGLVERAERRAAAQPIRCFVIGALTGVGLVTLGSAIAQAGGVGAFCGIALICATILFAHVGIAGIATHLGKRLPSPVDVDRPWRATIRGGVALELTWLLPILGWVGLMPISWMFGLGAAVLAKKDGWRAAEAEPPASVEASVDLATQIAAQVAARMAPPAAPAVPASGDNGALTTAALETEPVTADR